MAGGLAPFAGQVGRTGLDRPSTLSDKQKRAVRDDLKTGMSVSAMASKLITNRQTIMRVRDEVSCLVGGLLWGLVGHSGIWCGRKMIVSPRVV